MHHRRLGNSDLDVSAIGLGSWLTTYSGSVGEAGACACVDAAFDVGINFFDTANLYGRGAAETILGDILRDRRRDSYILATKLFFPMSDSDRGLSRAQIEKQLDASLVRLRTDYLDLYQCHRYDEETPLDETMEALTAAVTAGKVRYIGFSNWTSEQIEAAFALPGVERFVSSQPQYSLLWREPEETVIATCSPLGVPQIVFSPLAQGLLTGKYLPGSPPPVDSRAASPDMNMFMGHLLEPAVLNAVAGLKEVAAEAHCSLAQFALCWILREPNVASAIIGASRPEQVIENAKAADIRIDPELFVRAEAIAATVQFDYAAARAVERERFRKRD